MIKIKILSGPYAGKEREITEEMGVDPHPLFMEFVRFGYRWHVDYSRANESEKFQWWREDLAARIVRALREGRPVFFQDVEYRSSSSRDEVFEVAGKIEDAIVGSGYFVTVGYDDERGVLIATGPREHKLQ